MIKKTLENLCGFSRHQINTNKTIICFSKGIDKNYGRRLCETIGFQKVHNLGSYLGFPLFYERITNSFLRFVVKKVKARLQQWDARKLALFGKVTLPQPMLLTIPNYFMQIMITLKSICEEIEYIVRQFIWGHSRGSRKMTLVNWQFVCQP